MIPKESYKKINQENPIWIRFSKTRWENTKKKQSIQQLKTQVHATLTWLNGLACMHATKSKQT